MPFTIITALFLGAWIEALEQPLQRLDKGYLTCFQLLENLSRNVGIGAPTHRGLLTQSSSTASVPAKLEGILEDSRSFRPQRRPESQPERRDRSLLLLTPS